MIRRRFVMVPIFGDRAWNPGIAHVEAWGWLDNNKTFTPVHCVDRRNGFCEPVMGNAAQGGITIGKNMGLFDCEAARAIEVSKLPDTIEIPEAVRIMLAKAALLGEEIGS